MKGGLVWGKVIKHFMELEIELSKLLKIGKIGSKV